MIVSIGQWTVSNIQVLSILINQPWFLTGHLASRVGVVGQSQIHKKYLYKCCQVAFFGVSEVSFEIFNQIKIVLCATISNYLCILTYTHANILRKLIVLKTVFLPYQSPLCSRESFGMAQSYKNVSCVVQQCHKICLYQIRPNNYFSYPQQFQRCQDLQPKRVER